MAFKASLLVLALPWITIISNAITICNPEDFEHKKNFDIEQGGLSSVGVYLYKRDKSFYIRKLIPQQTVPGKTESIGHKSFITEVKVLEHLKNTGIAPKLLCASDSPDLSLADYSKKAGQVYLMMRMIRGKSLADISNIDNPKKLQNILKKTARRIYELHKNGVIHLDIKPDNIMIDVAGEVKLIDFGGSYSDTLQLPRDNGHCNHYFCHPSFKKNPKKTPAMDWFSFGMTAYVSRLIQLNLDNFAFKNNMIDLALLPKREKSLYELIQLCREGMLINDSYVGLFEKVMELDYFKYL